MILALSIRCHLLLHTLLPPSLVYVDVEQSLCVKLLSYNNYNMCSILAASTKQISFTFLVYIHECQKKSIVINYKYLLSVDIESFIYTLLL